MPSSQELSGPALVTGANGFLGTAIADALERRGHAVLRGARSISGGVPRSGRWVAYGEVGPHTEWGRALQDVMTVVHLAGIAHVADRPNGDVSRMLDHVNVSGTERLASAAAAQGVRRFLLMSSALVHGTQSYGRPISEDDGVCPSSPYARSKLQSEQCLRDVATSTGMQFVILRPPMVYGPHAQGNFKRLVRLVRSGIPLPLGAATAPRSFIGVANLADAVAECVEHPSAAAETYLVCDRETSSTADLIGNIAAALGRRVTNVTVSPVIVRSVLRAAGRESDFDRLFAPFEVESKHIERRLGWRAPVSLAEGIRCALGA